MNVLQAVNIDFSFDDRTPIFKQANLSITSASIVGIVGPNGSGKTTLFDLICNLHSVDSGVITQRASKQLYLSQTLTTPPALRMYDVFKMITLLASNKNITQHQVLAKLGAWSPGITERYKAIWNKKSSLCSYGEKRWFFTLTLLSLGADFIILDEPTAGVDPEFRHYIWQCLRGASSEGTTIVVSSHNIEEVIHNCNEFYAITKKLFLKFKNGESYKTYYNANSLDEAFIRSAADE
jgi:ABC-2 type transport system ATP-binding protein